jgi:hypothetical protein
MTSKNTLSLIAITIALTVAACGSAPARTETTRTTSVERSESGGEVRRDSTETTEVGRDGSQSTDRTETTQTTTPPPQ